jgi:hypothetical protein
MGNIVRQEIASNNIMPLTRDLDMCMTVPFRYVSEGRQSTSGYAREMRNPAT